MGPVLVLHPVNRLVDASQFEGTLVNVKEPDLQACMTLNPAKPLATRRP